MSAKPERRSRKPKPLQSLGWGGSFPRKRIEHFLTGRQERERALKQLAAERERWEERRQTNEQ